MDRADDLWLRRATLIALAAFAAAAVLGYGRPFWFDEVFTLGAAAPGRPLDWAVLKNDVHPPGFTLLVRWFGALVGGDAHALRLINLGGLVALAAGVWTAAQHLTRAQTTLLVCLLLVNGYALGMVSELRSYFLLYGLAALGQALILDELGSGRPRTAALALLAAALAALHFFGAAIGLALLLQSTILQARLRRWGWAMAGVLAGAAITMSTLVWAFFLSTALRQGNDNFWVRNETGHYVEFASNLAPLFLVALMGFAAIRRGARPAAPKGAMAMIFAPALVLAVAALISVVTPVITYRTLIVLVPGLSLAAVLACPPAQLSAISRGPVAAGLALIAAIYVWQGVKGHQYIRWAIAEATPPACDGAPLYVASPGIVDRFAQEVFRGAVKRPLKDFTEYAPPADLPPGCTVIATGWHEVGRVADVTAFFAARDTATEAALPPNPAIAAKGLMTHGFVIHIQE